MLQTMDPVFYQNKCNKILNDIKDLNKNQLSKDAIKNYIEKWKAKESVTDITYNDNASVHAVKCPGKIQDSSKIEKEDRSTVKIDKFFGNISNFVLQESNQYH